MSIDVLELKKSADYIRYLSLECIERAQSGHPGLPLGCADLGALLYRYVLKYNPEHPGWINRDRFILSAGHGSILLYSLLHLSGYDFSLEDLGNFRQLESKTPGHPEYDIPLGIETTTGPLGQGFTNAVGAAIEGKMLAQRFNEGEKGLNLFDYTVYTLMGDGCIMEGISYEAASMAGHLGLDNLVAIYDSNEITIDGRTDITLSEDVAKRFEAQGWIVENADVSDIQGVFNKLETLKKQSGKPKLLIVKTIIGDGLKDKKDKSDIHGAPAGPDEIEFFVRNSETVRKLFETAYGKDTVADGSKLVDTIKKRIADKEKLLDAPSCKSFMEEGQIAGKNAYTKWVEKLETYKTDNSEKYSQLKNFIEFQLPEELEDRLIGYTENKSNATRGICGTILNLCAESLPQLVGGTADLAGSTKALVKNSKYINNHDFSGRNIAFGVREHSMGAIGNGLALGKTLIPFTSTFFTFFDYMKPAVRLAALMQLNHLFIFSHDSIFVGEDGPTHQPIEHLNALRLIPDIYTFRPANAIETAFSFLYFFKEMNGPAAIITTRQKLPESVMNPPGNDNRESLFEQFKKGGYIIYETEKEAAPDLILAASGSEVGLAVETAKILEENDNKKVRIISIPCMELLANADAEYRDQLFGNNDAEIILVEAASYRAVSMLYGRNARVLDIKGFGVSAPGNKAAAHFGFTPETLYDKLK